MTDVAGTGDIKTLEQSLRRIEVLERKLDEAIDVILRRDASLSARERRIYYLEGLLDRHGIEYRPDGG